MRSLKKHIKNIKKAFQNSAGKTFSKKVRARSIGTKKALDTHMKKRPLVVFTGLLAVLLIVILIGNTLRQPDVEMTEGDSEPKIVSTYTIGSAPRVTVNARVEKSGVVTIVAQTSGVVQDIYCTEGEDFYKGNSLVRLSTNYQGGNALSVQRQIAQRQYEEAENTFLLQTDIINRQRDIARETENNDDELREITKQSIDETRSLIELNESSIELVDELIEITESASTPTTTAEKTTIASLKSQKSGLLNGLNAAKSALRNAEYSSKDENPQEQLADLSLELTLDQLELQEKTLQLNKEISRLQLRLAQINEALMYPGAPFSGRIERVHVRPGQVVNPGDPIATISGSEQSINVVVFVPEHIARNISKVEESTVHIEGPSTSKGGSHTYSMLPTYIAQEPTNGQLFAVLFSLPDEAAANVAENSVVKVDLPVGYADASGAVPFVPIDSVFQTQDAAYMYVINNGVAESREVKLGSLFGSFVEVVSGLGTSDQVILDRTVANGEAVEVVR